MIRIGYRFRMAVLALAAVVPASAVLAQDMTTRAFWDDVDRHIKDQQAEQQRLNEAAANQGGDEADESAGGRSGDYAPNSFVSFPPQAWADWVKHAQETHQQELEERFGKGPAYQALLRGAWTLLCL